MKPASARYLLARNLSSERAQRYSEPVDELLCAPGGSAVPARTRIRTGRATAIPVKP